MDSYRGLPGRSGLWLQVSTALLVLATLATPVPALAADPGAVALDEAVRARESYGFAAGRDHVLSLMRDGASVDVAASEKYGFPLTKDEYLDLLARNTNARLFQTEALPFVAGLDEYGGVWIDQEDNGRIVISLTTGEAAVKEEIRNHLPKGIEGVRFEQVNDSAEALTQALSRAEQDWASLGTGIEPQAFGIQYRHNRLVVKVRPSDLDSAKEMRGKMEEKVGVGVGFQVSANIVDTGCPERQKCFGPLRLGARMNYPDVYDSGDPIHQWNCAIGFMLSNHAILTAGHCVYDHTASWRGHQLYQDSYGRIGVMDSSRYVSTQHDLALITLEDWEANKAKRIFGDEWPTVLTMEDGILDNMDVCVSLSRQDKYWCGKVTEPSAKWKSTTANPDIWVYGAGMDFNVNGRTALGGDSGGPIVYETLECGTCTPMRTPVGIVNAGNEADDSSADAGDGSNVDNDLYFAKVQWALNNQDGWPNLEVYTGPEGDG